MKNKRNKLTNLFKIGVLLFGISSILINCQKNEDDFLEVIEKTRKKQEYHVKEFNKLNFKSNKKLKSKISQFNKLNSQKRGSSKVYDINWEKAIYI